MLSLKRITFINYFLCRAFLALLFIAFQSFQTQAENSKNTIHEIYISAQMSYFNERNLFLKLIREYEEKNPNVKIKTRFFRGDYSETINTWLKFGRGADIIYWYSGSHVKRLIKENKLKDLSSVWNKFLINQRYDHNQISSVSYEGKVYGIPISFYPWAIYYRHSIFNQFKLNVPKTWDDILSACKALHADNISLFAISSKSSWSLLAWLDYINLRLSGINFYRALVGGKARWDGENVRLALVYWKQLIEANCYNSNHAELEITKLLPLLYNKKAAMILSGSYLTGELPASIKHDFAVVPFPELKENMPLQTIAPIDTFIVPNYAKVNLQMERLLEYLSSEYFQLNLNAPSTRLPSNITAQEKLTDPLQNEAIKFINQSETLQYFDRESHPKLAINISAVLAEFLKKPDVDLTLKKLQQVSEEFYKTQ